MHMKVFWTIIILAIIAALVVLIFYPFDFENGLNGDGNGVSNGTDNGTSTEDVDIDAIVLDQSHSSPVNGFSIKYGDELGFLVTDEQINLLGYSAVCDTETSVGCVVFLDSLLPGRNFHGASVDVGILADIETEASCIEMRSGEQDELSARTIDDVEFSAFEYGTAATSRQVTGLRYRAFENGRCYQISRLVETTSFDVYEPGTIREFTDGERGELEDLLDRVINSFEFLEE
ncbi:MAG: hypothetical protein Q8Q32_01470 [bacterium]|nr:hypothetical protein [bacterium]